MLKASSAHALLRCARGASNECELITAKCLFSHSPIKLHRYRLRTTTLPSSTATWDHSVNGVFDPHPRQRCLSSPNHARPLLVLCNTSNASLSSSAASSPGIYRNTRIVNNTRYESKSVTCNYTGIGSKDVDPPPQKIPRGGTDVECAHGRLACALASGTPKKERELERRTSMNDDGPDDIQYSTVWLIFTRQNILQKC